MKRKIISLIPILVLIGMLAFNISMLGSDSIQGASQVALLFATSVCVWLSMWLFKAPWSAFEEAIKANIGNVTSAIVILLLIGAISGTWTMSGIVPTLICYGVKIISPKLFLPAACLICAAVSLMLGSSWTTIATIVQSSPGPISGIRSPLSQTPPSWHPPLPRRRCSRISAICSSPPCRHS